MMSVSGRKRDVLLTGSLTSVDGSHDRRPLVGKGSREGDPKLPPFYMGEMGSSLPNMNRAAAAAAAVTGALRPADSQGSSLQDSPEASPAGAEQVFKFDLVADGPRKLGGCAGNVRTSSSTSKLLQRPKPRPVVSLSGGDTSPRGESHKFLRESRSLDREDETDRFPEPRQLRR